jgi:hypothetical protein
VFSSLLTSKATYITDLYLTVTDCANNIGGRGVIFHERLGQVSPRDNHPSFPECGPKRMVLLNLAAVYQIMKVICSDHL